jgi:putative RNA 2'-phosphotransferase
LTLDGAGWADMAELVKRAGAAGMPLTRETVLEIVATSDKQRFAVDASGLRIRANQGHSIDIDLGLSPLEPPEVLFHGTARRNLPLIRAGGLRPGRRRHVHLSADRDTAMKVGVRHGKAVVLEVRSGRLWASGERFYRAANGVWLTPAVPPEFIAFPRHQRRRAPCAPPS